jgi:hypothetical protein
LLASKALAAIDAVVKLLVTDENATKR